MRCLPFLTRWGVGGLGGKVWTYQPTSETKKIIERTKPNNELSATAKRKKEKKKKTKTTKNNPKEPNKQSKKEL